MSGLVMNKPRPPFRADQVGSLLRPARLMEARQKAAQGQMDAAELRAVEDDCIRALAAKEESVGLHGITDGEFRRAYWHLDFLERLDGVVTRENPGPKFGGRSGELAEQPPIATVVGKVGCSKPIMVDDFSFLKSVTTRTAKVEIPSPSMLHLRGGRAAISKEAYPELDEFWTDVSIAYKNAIGHFADAGCQYLQLDDVAFAYLCDENIQASLRDGGEDPVQMPRTYADTINRALAGRSKDIAVTMHTCRGNFKSSWVATGGYEAVAEAMFSTDVDGFFMEFDSERAGSFEPLRLLPKGKNVVLGLVTSKSPVLEPKDALKRRIEEAAKYVPLENLCLSPQCGFSSTHHGNQLTEDEQWRKLNLVLEVAEEVWGGL
jgi:5-methyltetrahydropteroyltriglutamate--homocysteine methyltransferase